MCQFFLKNLVENCWGSRHLKENNLDKNPHFFKIRGEQSGVFFAN